MTSTHKHQIISIPYPSHKCLPEKSCLEGLRILTGFNLTTRDSYFTILAEVLANHVLAKNTYFTNHVELADLKIVILKPTKK